MDAETKGLVENLRNWAKYPIEGPAMLIGGAEQAAATITRLTAERDEARARAEQVEDLLLGSTERMEATLAAMDKYNEANGTYIIGPSLLGLGTQIAANRAALTQEATDGC